MAELVGANGPETVVPTEPGTVIPNDKLSLYQRMMSMLENMHGGAKYQEAQRQRLTGMPFSHMLGESLVNSLPVAGMALRPSGVRLAPRPGGGENILQVRGRFQRAGSPVSHPGSEIWPLPAGAVASQLVDRGGPAPTIARPTIQEDASPAISRMIPEDSSPTVIRPPEPEIAPAPASQNTPAKPAMKKTQKSAPKREPTLLEKLSALLPPERAPSAGTKRNVPPSGHYQYGGRPPIGQDAEVGEDGPEAFVPDREFNRSFGGNPREAFTHVSNGWRDTFDPGGGDNSSQSLQSLLGNGGGGFANMLASAFGGKMPFNNTGSASGPFSFLNMLGMKGFEQGGRPTPGEPVMVGEGGSPGAPEPEAFVPDDELHSMIMEATRAPTNPAAQPRMHKGREVADYSKRNPEAEVEQSKQRWMDIRDNPADVMSGLGLTGDIIGSAMKYGNPVSSAQAQPAGGKKESKPITPAEHIMKEQQELIEQGFLAPTYKDSTGKERSSADGAEGPATIAARKKRLESIVDRENQLKLEIEQSKTRVQEGAVIADQQRAQADLEKIRLEKDKLEKEKQDRDLKEANRKKGDEALKKAEDEAGWFGKFWRDWGSMLGYGAGGAIGVGSRLKVLKNANKASKEVAAAAEAPFAENLTNTSDRVARVNRYWREGGAGEAVPFSSNMSTKAGFSANPKPADLSTLYPAPTRSYRTKDIGIPVAALGESGLASGLAWDAQNRLDKAVAAYNADPTQANIDAIQSAKNYLASMEFMANAGRGTAAGYLGTAAKTSRNPTRPNTSPAEAEKMELEKLLPRQRTPKQEVLPPPPKQLQAGVPPALGPEAWMARQVAPPAPMQALPPPSMVPPASLQEMVQPPRQARVPRKPKKVAND